MKTLVVVCVVLHTLLVLSGSVSSFPFRLSGFHAAKRHPERFGHGLSWLENWLSTLEETPCPNSGDEASWREYCDDTGAVLQCPLDKPPTFYENRCKTALFVHRLKERVPTDASPAAAIENVTSILDGLSSGWCGGSVCRLDEAICDRGINEVCLPAEEVCGMEHYRERCLRTACFNEESDVVRGYDMMRTRTSDEQPLRDSSMTTTDWAAGVRWLGSTDLSALCLIKNPRLSAHLYLAKVAVLDHYRQAGSRRTATTTRTMQPMPIDPGVIRPTPSDTSGSHQIIIGAVLGVVLSFVVTTTIVLAIRRWKQKKRAGRPQKHS